MCLQLTGLPTISPVLLRFPEFLSRKRCLPKDLANDELRVLSHHKDDEAELPVCMDATMHRPPDPC